MAIVRDESFIDLSKMNPHIVLDIKYATADNFFKKPLYRLSKAFLRKSVAQKIDRVQQSLEKIDLGLKIWDAYRPLPVQQYLWEIVPDERYVADPKKGSVHNRGAAVDVTLVDSFGNELQMPTVFDDFTEKAHIGYELVSDSVRSHRELLRNYMVHEGFIPIATEWWHFDDEDALSYPLCSYTFEELTNL